MPDPIITTVPFPLFQEKYRVSNLPYSCPAGRAWEGRNHHNLWDSVRVNMTPRGDSIKKLMSGSGDTRWWLPMPWMPSTMRYGAQTSGTLQFVICPDEVKLAPNREYTLIKLNPEQKCRVKIWNEDGLAFDFTLAVSVTPHTEEEFLATFC